MLFELNTLLMGRKDKQKELVREEQQKPSPAASPAKDSPVSGNAEGAGKSPKTVPEQTRMGPGKDGRQNTGFSDRNHSSHYREICGEIGLCFYCFDPVYDHPDQRACRDKMENVHRRILYDRLKFLDHFAGNVVYDQDDVLWFDFGKGTLQHPHEVFDLARTRSLSTQLEFRDGCLVPLSEVWEKEKQAGLGAPPVAPVAAPVVVPVQPAVPSPAALPPVVQAQPVQAPPLVAPAAPAPVVLVPAAPAQPPQAAQAAGVVAKISRWYANNVQLPANVTLCLGVQIRHMRRNLGLRKIFFIPQAPFNPALNPNVAFTLAPRVGLQVNAPVGSSAIKYGKFISQRLRRVFVKTEPSVKFWKQDSLAYNHAKNIMDQLLGKRTGYVYPIVPRGLGSGTQYNSFSISQRNAHVASCYMKNRWNDFSKKYTLGYVRGKIERVLGLVKDFVGGILNSDLMSRIGRRGYQTAIRINGHSASYRQVSEMGTWSFFLETTFPRAILGILRMAAVRTGIWTGCFSFMAVVDTVVHTTRLVSSNVTAEVVNRPTVTLAFSEMAENLASVAQKTSNPHLEDIFFNLNWLRILRNSSFPGFLSSRLFFNDFEWKALGDLVTNFDFAFLKELSVQRALLFLPKVCYWSGILCITLVCISRLSLGVEVPVTKVLYDARPCESHIAVNGGVDVRNSSLRVGDAQKETLRADSNVLYYQLYISLFGTYWRFVTRERLAYSTTLLADLNSPRMQPLSLLGKDSDVLNRIVTYASQSAHLNDNTSEYAMQNTCKLALMFAITRMNKEPFSAPQLGEGNRSGH